MPSNGGGLSALKQRVAEQEAVRNELFAGPNATAQQQTPEQSAGGAELTTDQLVSKATSTHKETTRTAQRALKVLEESKQVQANTMKELDKHGQKIDSMQQKLHKINHELTYSEKLLSYMRRCCCCWVCDSCTGADPEAQRRRNWEDKVEKGLTNMPSGRVTQESRRGTLAGASTGASTAAGSRRTTAQGTTGGFQPSARVTEEPAQPGDGGAAATSSQPSSPLAAQGFREPDLRLPEQYGKQEMALHHETQMQNDMLDKIADGLGDLLGGAQRIGTQLEAQTKALAKVQDKAEDTTERIEDVNTKSQLRKFKIPGLTKK